MPDIKTALEQALAKAKPQLPAEWDDEGGAAAIETITTQAKEATVPKKLFETTNNVTRATFNYIVAHPGSTRREILTALEEQSFKQGSTSSLLGQFSKQGHIIVRGGFYFAQHDDYRPLKTMRKKVKTPKPQAKQPERKKVVVVSKRTGEVVSATPQINSAWDAATLLNNLSIKQARALYDELRTIFGG